MAQLSSENIVLLGTAYLPPIDYFVAMVSSGSVVLEQYENYTKQSYRNRCKIFASDGVLSLTIPVINSGNNTPIRDIQIDYSKKWLPQHKMALVSAYRSSPFFEYYQDDIFGVLDVREKYLFDLNFRLIEVIKENIGIDKAISLSDGYVPGQELDQCVSDMRESIHPKKESPIFSGSQKQKPYYQVFSQKYGFVGGLSIVDLLFNEGPESYRFLKI